ncbi:class I adenylate-forming enzyme family protein [Pseudonocardia sp. NPDC049154]|uniref:class I adenylate-forming enzyme family protein n=1 Tax=Pseudonocardia sp. NPDC049154 TaxID=3155501 RepID=UPI0034089534
MTATTLSLVGRIAWQARTRPSATALIDDAGSVGFAELWEVAQQVAGALRVAGLRPGDRVALALRPSAGYVALVLGAMAGGQVPVPVNTRLTPPEVAGFLEPLDPALVLADPAHADLAAAPGRPFRILERAEEPGPLAARVEPVRGALHHHPSAGDAPAIAFPTGGTTGLPKGAVYTHERLWLFANSAAAARPAVSAWDPPGTHQELYFSPFFHVSLCTGLLTTLFSGGTVRIMPAFDTGGALAHIAAGATQLMGSPTMFVALRTHPDFTRTDRSGVELVIFGSTHATPEFVDRLREDYPNARLRYGFGATEYGPVAAMTHEDMLAGRLSGVGRAYPDADIRILDPEGRELGVGEVGEITVRCAWHAVAYWGRPEESAATFTPDGVRLGDLGHLDADGWLTMDGRLKEMIISGGENVFPAEVESALDGHPAVAEICVYGAADEYWGERVEAAVVLRPGARLELEELRAHGRNRLASYKLPKALRIVDALPITPNNKPDRRALRAAAQVVA